MRTIQHVNEQMSNPTEAKHNTKDDQGKSCADMSEFLRIKEKNDELKKVNEDKENAMSDLKSEMEKAENDKVARTENTINGSEWLPTFQT